MARSIDLCTCGRDRSLHEPRVGLIDGPVIGDHQFMPHPQPNAEPKISFGRKLQLFLESCGEVKYRGTSAFVKELDGTVWEVSNFLRKDPAVNSEGM